MSRSIAAAPARRRIGAPARGRSAAGAPRPTLGVLRPLAAAASRARVAVAFVQRRRRLRIALLCAVVAMPLLGCGWLWLRTSPLVAVQKVQITGVHGAEAQAVQAALTQAAHGMSTLDVNTAALSAAVASLRVVRGVRVVPRFPHGLRIDVSEQLPVAALTVAGVRTAVAADGVVLGSALLSGSLPSVSGYAIPAPGKHVHSTSLLAALTVLGAAPALLAKHVERVFTGTKGLTVAMRDGLLVYFGDASRPHAKWLSLARVLADSSSTGASYVDVRLPSRPAAGFPAGVTPPDANASASATTTGASGEATGSSESAVASLAAGLSSGTTTTSATAAEPPAASASGTTSTPTENSPASSGEAGSGGEAESSQTGTEPSTGAGG